MWDLRVAKAYQEEQQRLARRGVQPPAAELSEGYRPRRQLRFRLRCACGQMLVALGLRLLAGIESPAGVILPSAQKEAGVAGR